MAKASDFESDIRRFESYHLSYECRKDWVMVTQSFFYPKELLVYWYIGYWNYFNTPIHQYTNTLHLRTSHEPDRRCLISRREGHPDEI